MSRACTHEHAPRCLIHGRGAGAPCGGCPECTARAAAGCMEHSTRPDQYRHRHGQHAVQLRRLALAAGFRRDGRPGRAASVGGWRGHLDGGLLRPGPGCPGVSGAGAADPFGVGFCRLPPRRDDGIVRDRQAALPRRGHDRRQPVLHVRPSRVLGRSGHRGVAPGGMGGGRAAASGSGGAFVRAVRRQSLPGRRAYRSRRGPPVAALHDRPALDGAGGIHPGCGAAVVVADESADLPAQVLQ